MVDINDPEGWRRARETYGSSVEETKDSKGSSHTTHERLYEAGEKILSVILTVLKWAAIIIVGVLVFAIVVFIAVGTFGLLKFGWTQL